jgi:FkbM family methyltransferase
MKLAIARILNRYLRIVRGLCGWNMRVVCRRGGLVWDLDLNEGIDLCIYLLGSYEAAVQRTYRTLVRPGDVVFDVGANVGAHTLHFARLVGATGQVHAFEPTDFAYGKLRRNLALNPEIGACVRAHQLFLSAGEAEELPAEICSSWPVDRWTAKSISAELNERHLGLVKPLQGASGITGDAFFAAQGLTRLDFIKIDVDGNECSVLNGLHRTLEKFRPTVIIELDPFLHESEARDAFDECVVFLRNLGYAFFDANTRRPIPSTGQGLREHIPSGMSINGLLLFPGK